jgi:hypothetical protein|tara:strand:+ start:452 stop:829 length:378 start_codon:yes stop_codon:yes gene_type:complete
MKVTLSSLKNILQTNACEIAFTKRRPKPGDRLVRNMLCTLDNSILNSVNGRITLNYKPPGGAPKYNPESKNLLLVWDIIMQSWRMVSMDSCEINKTIPGNDEFWKYFNENILTMTGDEKLNYMGT